MSGKNNLPPFFEDTKFGDDEDIFSILEALECVSELSSPMGAGMKEKTCSSGGVDEQEREDGGQKWKRQKVVSDGNEEGEDGQQKVSHIAVERNRRKQMNDNLTVLRSLMPCFYVKRGDQASIIEGVVDYIKEMQQVLKSLEAKKQRKIYSEVLSPRLASSPRPTQLSPRQPPPSPRPISLPISPRTPQSTSPYKPWVHQAYLSPTTMASPLEPSPSPCSSSSLASSINDAVNELVANSKSAMAEVEVKFSGSNVLLKTISPRIPGQAVKIIAAIEEELSLEILNVNISTIEETLLNSFTIKIGIECQLSAEDLAHQIQQTFC